MDVRMPDGVILRGVPDGTPKDEIMRKYNSRGAKSQAPDQFAADPLLSNQSMQQLSAGRSAATQEPSAINQAVRYGQNYTTGMSQANDSLSRAVAGGSSPVLGGLEALATLGTGAVSPVAGLIGGAFTRGKNESLEQAADRVAKASTYQPRTEAGKATLGLIGAAAKPVTDLASSTGADIALAPLTHEMQGLNAIPRVPRVTAPRTAEEVLTRLAPQDSAGAAAASRAFDASPELKQAIVATSKKTGGLVNPQALERHVDAETLPVPVRLTEGMATQDPTLISHEMNLRGAHKELAGRFEDINKSLAENIKTLRDEAGPDVFSTNATEHGDTLIAAYKARDEAARTDIGAKYKALADANGGNLPVNGAAFVKAAESGLKKEMKVPFLPSPIKTIMEDLRKGEPMTIESFENLRTALAAEGRKADRAGDGNAAAAIHVVRDALESVPIEGASAQVKQLADAARSAARQRFSELKADPAYKAAVDDAVSPDRFVQKFVISAPRDQVAMLSQAMQGNDQAAQTIRVAVLDHLRDQARLNPLYEGNFAAASYNKALRQLDPKLRHLLPSETADNVERLGRVAGYATSQPKGSFVNNSNTFVAQAANYGADALEGAANVSTFGIPIGTWARKGFEGIKKRREVKSALAPGAGLGRGLLDE